ncbi:hypothetical protein [Streptomyces nigrescens]|uniref:hypothetical protein n=1 Tax=Streptomyces nigrescens TaxID=1920 RepID=UPI0036FDE502
MSTDKRTINGLKVIEWEYAETPRSTPTKPRHYEEVIKVLLEDSSVVYACIWQGCEFTRPSASGVWPHLKVHRPKEKKPTAPTAVDVSDMTVSEVLERAQLSEQYRTERDAALNSLDKVTKELAAWKPRAKAAEKQVKAIRNAFTS